MEEHCVCNAKVTGSSPVTPTISLKRESEVARPSVVTAGIIENKVGSVIERSSAKKNQA